MADLEFAPPKEPAALLRKAFQCRVREETAEIARKDEKQRKAEDEEKESTLEESRRCRARVGCAIFVVGLK
jgi:hypothetical protein